MEENIHLRPCVIEFSKAQIYKDKDSDEFFNYANPKTFQAYGLLAEFKSVYKLISIFDQTDESEHTGIIIPKSCVKRLMWLEEMVPLIETKDRGES